MIKVQLCVFDGVDKKTFLIGSDITDIDVGVDVDEVGDEMVFSFGLEEIKLYLAVENGKVDLELYYLGELGVLP